MRRVCRFEFGREVPMEEVEETLLLAVLAAEGVHGQAQVRLDAGYHLAADAHACVVDTSTPVGETVAQVFTGYLIREFGEDAFHVERVVAADLAAVGPGARAGAAR